MRSCPQDQPLQPAPALLALQSAPDVLDQDLPPPNRSFPAPQTVTRTGPRDLELSFMLRWQRIRRGARPRPELDAAHRPSYTPKLKRDAGLRKQADAPEHVQPVSVADGPAGILLPNYADRRPSALRQREEGSHGEFHSAPGSGLRPA